MTSPTPFQHLEAVLFDWAGTTIDFGSRAPTEVFLEIFRRRGVEVTVAEARGPMGRAKLEHIAEVARLPRVQDAWRAVHGRDVTDADVLAMYENFLPLQQDILSRGSELIPGVVDVVTACRARGLKIGSTTGYTKALMEVVAPSAAKSGYAPDVIVCPDDVRAGRPAPWLNFRAAEALNVYPMSRVVVVDDTPVGLQAGRNAGCWTIGVAMSGNALGLSLAEVQGLSSTEREGHLARITADFVKEGAHAVIPSVAELIPILERIDALIGDGASADGTESL